MQIIERGIIIDSLATRLRSTLYLCRSGVVTSFSYRPMRTSGRDAKSLFIWRHRYLVLTVRRRVPFRYRYDPSARHPSRNAPQHHAHPNNTCDKLRLSCQQDAQYGAYAVLSARNNQVPVSRLFLTIRSVRSLVSSSASCTLCAQLLMLKSRIQREIFPPSPPPAGVKWGPDDGG